MSKLSTGALLVALAALAACGGDTTAPSQKTSNDLHFLRLSTSAPPLQATVVSFYALKGADREIRVRFQNGEDFLRFRVFANSLLQRPDGSAFANGDSVKITITITDPVTLERPWTVTYAYRRMPGYTLLEYVCEDNREYVDDQGRQALRLPSDSAAR